MSANISSSEAVRNLSASLGVPLPVEIPADAFAAPFEELIIVYSVGVATFSGDHRFISFQGEVFQVNQVADGRWSGTWELKVDLEAARSTPQTADPPFNRPAGKVATTLANAFSKARWDFGDGSSITVAGAGFAHTSTTSMLNNVVWLSGNQLISFGTGRFEGAQGTKTAAIGLWLRPNQPFQEAHQVEMKSLDIFRVFPQSVIASAASLPRPA
jgi:hypothetical protein